MDIKFRLYPVTFDIRCLPLKHTNDGKMDCLGGTDKREYCRQVYPEYFFSRYRCWNESICHLNACQGPKACFFEKDTGFEQVCNTNANIKAVLGNVNIDKYWKSMTVDQGDRYRFPRYIYFSLYSSNSFPFKSAYASLTNMNKIVEKSSEHASDQNTQLSVRQNEPRALNKKIDFRRAWICNRGILVYVNRDYYEHCLCPPSYYGDQCQFQSQRVSLIVKFRQGCAPNCHAIYAIVLALVDQNRMIYSSEQSIYIPTTKNCTMKHNIYFLYGLRQKI